MDACGTRFETLLNYHENRLVGEARENLLRHLTECTACQQTLGWLTETLPALTAAISTPELQVSDAALNRAFAIAREQTAPRPESLLERFARLVFDSRTVPTAMPSRGENAADIQLVYHSEAHEVDLWQERQENGDWYVIGQVLPSEGDEILQPERVTFRGQDGTTRVATRDADDFILRATPPGTYEIRIRIGEIEIVLPQVAVGN